MVFVGDECMFDRVTYFRNRFSVDTAFEIRIIESGIDDISK